LGLLYGGKEYGLLPVWRAATANPRVRGRNRTAKDGGKACGAKGKAIVPSHAGRIHQKEKCAMRKIMLAIKYAMRKVSIMKATQWTPWTVWTGLNTESGWIWTKAGTRGHARDAKALARKLAREHQITSDFGDGRAVAFGFGDYEPNSATRICNRNGTFYTMSEVCP
jgi:hypothetical protein